MTVLARVEGLRNLRHLAGRVVVNIVDSKAGRGDWQSEFLLIAGGHFRAH